MGEDTLETRVALLEAKVRLISITLKSFIALVAGAVVAYFFK